MGTVQIIARTIAMLCVPIVMLAKPLSREMGGNEDIFSISVYLGGSRFIVNKFHKYLCFNQIIYWYGTLPLPQY
jgi:hypothetical protein